MMISIEAADVRVRNYGSAAEMRAFLRKNRARLRGRPEANREQDLKAAFDRLPGRLRNPAATIAPPKAPATAGVEVSPQPAVAPVDHFIVHRCNGTFDVIEGHKINDRPLSENEALQVKAVLEPAEPSRPLRIEHIQYVVAQHYNVSRIDILSARRTHNAVRPRQIAMYLARTLTKRTLPEIGRRFGGRDHTTVMHAVRKIEALIPIVPAFAAAIAVIKAELGAA
jgi:hypothetical protein